MVLVLRGDGTPFANKLVTLDVTRSDGRLTTDGNGEGTMMLQVRADGNGEARAFWTLGLDAGCGNNRLEATSKDIAGTVAFCASATPAPAAQINIGSGNNQRVETGGPAPEPLRVWVNDRCNGVGNIPVMFTVTRGSGTVNGQNEAVVITSGTGHAEVNFTLGPDPGNNAVQATFQGNTTVPAEFVIFGVARDENQPTTFFGLVFNNADQPVQGARVTLSINGQALPPVDSDLNGHFGFDDISIAGPAKLHVDGLTATHIGGAEGIDVPPGSFPALEFDTVLVPNAANALSTPVLLPPLDPANAVSFNNSQDVELTVEGIEGLSMLVRAGSMTRADGTVPSPAEPAIIALNQVNFDDVPMPMPDGAAPPFAWTLQPAGAHFDPPVEVTYPNMSGLRAGSIAYFLSFNHDTGKFEIIATGRVTDDGSSIISDPGAGITVSGWGCNCPPYSVAGDCERGGGGGGDDPEDCIDEPCKPPGGEDPPASPSGPAEKCADDDDGGDDDPGDPIYPFSGEFYEKVVDLRIKGRILDFIWARKCASKRGVNSVQGNGWDCSYNIFIELEDEDLILCDGNSRRDLYPQNQDGAWTKHGFFREFTQNQDGTITQEFADKGQWIFNAFDGSTQAGKIAEIVERNGNTLSFTYDVQGRLIVVTDTLGRDIQLAYNGDGFIESITDFNARQVRYEYYQNGDAGGSFGDLMSVTSPAVTGTPNGNDFVDGKTTIYTYTTGFFDERLNHDLLTITDPKGQLYLQNIYAHTVDPSDPRFTEDPQDFNYDRIVRQIWGGPLDIIDLVYLPQEPSTMNNGAVVKVIYNDRVGNIKEFFYDALNRRVMDRVFTGRSDPFLPTTEFDNRPSGKLRPDDPAFFQTLYSYNSDSKRTRTVYPNGNVTVNIYEDDLNSNASARTRGNLRQRIRIPSGHSPAGDQTQIVEQFGYDTDFNSCCGFNFVSEYVDGRGNVTLSEFDDRGNLIRRQERIPSIVEDFEYNEFGQMTAHVLPDNGSSHRRRDEFTYYDTGPQRGYRELEIVDAAGFALTTTYEYDLVGNVVGTTDPRGHDTQLVVNELDQVVRRTSREVADGSGIRYQRDLFYDANNNVVRLDIQNIDETGAVLPNTHFTSIYEYEILNYLIRTCREVGDYTGAIPGTPQLPICQGLPESEFLTTEYEYDANRNQTLTRYGEAVEGRQPENAEQTIYDERDLVFRMTRAPGHPDQSTTQFEYDGNRNTVVRRVGLEDSPRVWASEFDGYNRLVTDVDPMGNRMTYNYDANHNVVREFHAGELIDVPGESGNVRLTEVVSVYDEIDRLVRKDEQFFDTDTGVAIGDGIAVTQVFYSDNSQVIRTVNDNNHETLTAYDTANRRSVVTDAKSNTVTFGYDANSNVLSRTEVEKSDLAGPDEVFTTTYTYDGLDRRTSSTDNVGNTNASLYDSRNNRVVAVDALNHQVRYLYDGINRLIRTIRDLDDDGADSAAMTGDGNADVVTAQVWDDTSRLVQQVDDNGNATTYMYDPLDRMTVEQYADGTQRTYVYDVHDNRLTMTDANGSVATCTYDLLDRLTGKTIVLGAGVSSDTTFEVYAYDGLSRPVHIEDDDSLVTRSYNSRSGVTRETLTIDRNGPAETAGTTLCVYDGVGNMLVCTYPGQRQITYTFDELERKKAISDQSGMIARYDYVGRTRVTRREYGNNTRTDYAYDGITGIGNPVGDFAVKKIIGTRHTRIGDGSVIDDRAYTWDRMYNKTQRRDLRADGPRLTHDYAYDDIYRLVHTTVTDAGPVVLRDTDYDLDGVGNRTTVAGAPDPGPHVGPYTLDSTQPEPADFRMNQYTTTSADARVYDKNGNLMRIDHGLPDELHIAYDYRNQMVAYTVIATGERHTYAYDVLGRRIARVVDADGVAGGPAETRYFYDGRQVCEEQDAVAAAQATYVYGLYIDAVLNMQRAGSDFFYHTDDLYSVMAVTAAAATVVERYEYQDYGQPEFFDASSIPIPQSAIANPYLFTGRRLDPETGWYYYRTRYLDPIAGRFTTRDTIGIWGDTNSLGSGYEYVGNSPSTRFDPSGLSAYDEACDAGDIWACAAVAVDAAARLCDSSSGGGTWAGCLNRCLARRYRAKEGCWKTANTFWGKECCHHRDRIACNRSCPAPGFIERINPACNPFMALWPILDLGLDLPGCKGKKKCPDGTP